MHILLIKQNPLISGFFDQIIQTAFETSKRFEIKKKNTSYSVSFTAQQFYY